MILTDSAIIAFGLYIFFSLLKVQDSNITDGNLRAELDAYILNPDDIQEVPEQIPLDDKLIEQEMKEKGMENIQTYYKSSRLHIKELEGTLTRQEKEQEQLAQRKQLEEIYKLMAREKDKFGVDSMDEIEDQMKLYNLQ
ncbi:hypothetical protein QZH41_011703 [Actinostola sp. cb2023]|nr:hypothetical protein QZH41_011703 [Actinostola sp. cb2023]